MFQILSRFCERAFESKDDPVKLDKETHSAADSLVSMINAHTAATVIAVHTGMKEVLAKVINETIDMSAKSVIGGFKDMSV